MSSDCVVVKDAPVSQVNEVKWLGEQLLVALRNLTSRPLERRGPYEVTDELIEDLNHKYDLR
ncbi:hypothetical protein RHAB21_02136 [Pseudorhizobium halotolerans]|uniref:Uncharacterized protein n=1 Tax=Pseudorhizobium halotolerans TaxID=1233081 RepID=A0ABM8PJH1_9HYPH|nr:hypothetical protein RHAB21_02136 [Pseudorhizobium halotolerans]